jgi:NADH-quinone oxidoreductase subunit A
LARGTLSHTDNMLQDYAPILLLIGLVAAFAVGNIVLSELVGRRRRVIGKGDPYECGMPPQGNARLRLSIHFYLTAVLFILFDVEGIFLILWANSARAFNTPEIAAGGLIFAEILVFVAMLVVALAFVWRKGGLEWDR